jgi:hypothetical protein
MPCSLVGCYYLISYGSNYYWYFTVFNFTLICLSLHEGVDVLIHEILFSLLVYIYISSVLVCVCMHTRRCVYESAEDCNILLGSLIMRRKMTLNNWDGQKRMQLILLFSRVLWTPWALKRYLGWHLHLNGQMMRLSVKGGWVRAMGVALWPFIVPMSQIHC